MPPRKRKPEGPWVKLMANTWLDEALRRAGPWAELIYYRALQQAKTVNRDGQLSAGQLKDISRGIYDFPKAFRRLVMENLLILDPQGGGVLITSWSKYNETAASAEEATAQATARKQRQREREYAARDVDASSVTVTTQRREEKRREEGSSSFPEGTERTTSASAAPRSAGGAAHPPQDPEWAGVSLAAKAAQAEMRRTIAESRSDWRPKLNKPPLVGNGRDAHVDFSATLAKLTAMAERTDE